MYPTLGLVSLAAVLAAALYGWRQMSLRQLALDRLAESELAEPAALPRVRMRGPLARRWWWTPWLLGIVVGLVAFFFVQIGWVYSAAVALIVGLLASQVEGFLAARTARKLESQLADAIDLMIGALGAGAGVSQALAAAGEETKQPLRDQLDDVLGRIRLGDDPQHVFRSLAERVPLETFTLFSSALAVNWVAGGSLTPTLAHVGRTIRDRIEISRRIASNIAQSQLSTVFILLLTYFIAAIVWRNNPAQMQTFVNTEVGSYFVAGSMVLQCVGIVWMNAISKPRW
jgi:Flp pilus assembly protein TadB